MVYGAPSKRGDGTAAGVDAVGPLGGVWAAQCVRYGHPHDSRPVHSLFTSLHCFGADSASGWASCASQWARCLWTWQRWWWWWKWQQLAHWQVAVAVGQTGRIQAISQAEKKRKKTSRLTR